MEAFVQDKQQELQLRQMKADLSLMKEGKVAFKAKEKVETASANKSPSRTPVKEEEEEREE